jgi:hypothetical protein
MGIGAVESRPNEISGARASTASLILSIFFLKVLWISDPTSMCANWVARQFVKWKSASRPAGGHRRVGLLRNALGRRAPRARVSLIKLMNASASLTLH